MIETIEWKALRFIELKMDKAIDENDIGTVEKLLCMIQRLKKWNLGDFDTYWFKDIKISFVLEIRYW